MQATNESERTLLENSMIILTSSLFDGNAPRFTPTPRCPGGGRRRWHDRRGTVTTISWRIRTGKRAVSYIALMDRMGVKIDHFGDAENALQIQRR